MKIGFKFAKTAKPKSSLVQTSINSNIESTAITEDNDIDFVTSIDNKTVKGTKDTTKKKQEYVIPLIVVNKYRVKKEDVKPIVKEETPTIKIEEPENNSIDIVSQAKQELIKEAKNINEDESVVPAWKSLIINKAPDEYENDSKLDVSIRPEEPTLDNYETIPIEAFGTAMLRGMGWKEGEAIGGINKSVTPIFEPQIRARGLGLGADVSLKKQLDEMNKNKNRSNSEEVTIRKGCHVCVEVGPYKGYFGIIESVSEDLSHVSVKFKFISETIDIPQALLRVVSKKEYDEEGRIINKSKYDEYKEKESFKTVSIGSFKIIMI